MNTQQSKKQIYLALPVLALPFITMIFWALGGGQGNPAQGSAIPNAGLNPELPRAQLQNDANAWDKLRIYEKAMHDSLAQREAKKNDPYFRFSTLTEMQELEQARIAEQSMINTSLGKKDQLVNSDEEKVQDRLDQLYKAINQNTHGEVVNPNTTHDLKSSEFPSTQIGGDVDRLEQLMTSMNQGRQENPELSQMDDMLEKILDIQHPERVSEKIADNRAKQPKTALPVNNINPNRNISRIESNHLAGDSLSMPIKTKEASNSFFGLSDESLRVDIRGNVFEAVVHDTQTLMAGSIVKLRLTKPIDINGNHLPENNFIFGVASISGERLEISITSIRYQNLLLPVELTVYDLDGMTGIFIPGAIERDAAKQSTSQSIQQMQVMSSMSQSIGAQAAGAGIEAAKGLFSKKIKLVKVTVKAGYQVFLLDANSND